MIKKQTLLQPIQIGDLQLKNRIIMAPLTRCRANNKDNIPTPLHVEYYSQRAQAGLIISEGSPVSKRGVGYIYTPGIYTKKQVDAWKKVTKGVHQQGGKIFIQLWHVGRISHPDFHNGKKPLAPSALNPNIKSFTANGLKNTVTPKEMSLVEISETIIEFKKAAKNAIDAGFDGVEIHSSNGYLFHQFFSKQSNIRVDDYGGSMEKRTRFLFEVIDAIKMECPENRIGVRLNPSLHGLFGIEADKDTLPTFEYIVHKLNQYNLAYLHLSEPFNDVSKVPFVVKEVAKHFRPLFHGNLIINSNFDQKSGNEVIKNDYADMVAFGKLFISNPDLPTRFEKNALLQAWDTNTFYTQGKKGYTDYPSLNN